MFGWLHTLDESDDEKAYELCRTGAVASEWEITDPPGPQVVNAETPEHKVRLTHQLIVVAAPYAAAKKYEDHCKAEGKPKTHAEARQLIVEYCAAFVDLVVETKGLDEIDTEKAKRDAANRALKQSKEILAAEY